MLCVREVVEPMPQDAMDYASDNPSDDDKPQQEANDKEAAQKTTTETQQADRDNTVVKKLTGDNKGTSEFENHHVILLIIFRLIYKTLLECAKHIL